MRKLWILTILLWASMAVAQQPQWHVVASVDDVEWTSPISPTTLFTSSDNGTYRMTIYFSGGGGASTMGAFDLVVSATDITNSGYSDNFAAPCGKQRFVYQSPVPIKLKSGTPLNYEVDAVGTVPLGCNYNMTITVEELQ